MTDWTQHWPSNICVLYDCAALADLALDPSAAQADATRLGMACLQHQC